MPDTELTISKENRMPQVENQQYQHNGSGTAILVNKKYNHKPGAERLNDHKHVTCIMQNENKTKWIVAGIHADNGKGEKKWEKVNSDMVNLSLQYPFPIIVYLDINTDIQEVKY